LKDLCSNFKENLLKISVFHIILFKPIRVIFKLKLKSYIDFINAGVEATAVAIVAVIATIIAAIDFEEIISVK
jgi:hypothetical protein